MSSEEEWGQWYPQQHPNLTFLQETGRDTKSEEGAEGGSLEKDINKSAQLHQPCTLTDHCYCQQSAGWTTKHSKLQTLCQSDNGVTTPGLCTILSCPACHLLELFHGSGSANINIKVFLFARNFSPLVHSLTFWAFVFSFSSSVLFSESLVILCNCWWKLGRSGASSSQYSCRDESNELSLARLPELCVFPQLHLASDGWQRVTTVSDRSSFTEM